MAPATPGGHAQDAAPPLKSCCLDSRRNRTDLQGGGPFVPSQFLPPPPLPPLTSDMVPPGRIRPEQLRRTGPKDRAGERGRWPGGPLLPRKCWWSQTRPRTPLCHTPAKPGAQRPHGSVPLCVRHWPGHLMLPCSRVWETLRNKSLKVRPGGVRLSSQHGEAEAGGLPCVRGQCGHLTRPCLK